MKKRVGILTLYARSCNYGGVLQAYALCELVARENCTPQQILYVKKKSGADRLRAICRKSPKHLVIRLFQQLQTKLCDRLYHVDAGLEQRRAAFDRFKKTHIPDSGTVYHQQTIAQAVPDYDVFICGSDQVWNPNVVDDAYFLRFVPEKKGRFAYAVSIAAPIPAPMRQRYADAMERLDGVSVREACACAQLTEIAPVPVQWVLDPVLMLDRADWEAVAAPEEEREPYLLCYFLGNDGAYRRIAEAVAGEKGWKIVTLPYVSKVHPLSDRKFGDQQLFDVGPDRFLSLIRGAACVLTDSFHAVALCHIFEKNFWALRRTSQHISEGRVESLLKGTGLEDRYLRDCGADAVTQILTADGPDFSEAKRFLMDMRGVSLEYLRKNLRDETYEN